MTEPKPDQALREEFNRWAEAGRGAEMEQDHLPITLPVLEKMRLAPTDNVLDVGCGAGWLSQRLAKLVPEGRVVGMDISDEMIRHARRASADFGNLLFVTGEVKEIPWQPHFFSHAISVESSYYWPDPAAGIKDIFRVLRDGGSAWIRTNRGSIANASNLYWPVVSRCGAAPRVQSGRRAADTRCERMKQVAASGLAERNAAAR